MTTLERTDSSYDTDIIRTNVYGLAVDNKTYYGSVLHAKSDDYMMATDISVTYLTRGCRLATRRIKAGGPVFCKVQSLMLKAYREALASGELK